MNLASETNKRKGPFAMKGRERNMSCPCGSGKKLKKCCGTDRFGWALAKTVNGKIISVPVIFSAAVRAIGFNHKEQRRSRKHKLI